MRQCEYQQRPQFRFVMDISQHPRIVNPNPLVKLLEAGANPKTVVPDNAIIVRGGQSYTHQPDYTISAQMGSNVRPDRMPRMAPPTPWRDGVLAEERPLRMR